MIDRRDLLIGGLCAAGLAGAEYFRPRKMLSLFAGDDLGAIIPHQFGDWKSIEGGNIIVPKTPGSLADRLYSDTVQRTYRNVKTGEGVMLLIAYGRSQSDLLQLHRPESCYPAIGLGIKKRQFTDISIDSSGRTIPAVALTAGNVTRTEDIVYWTRLGNYLPRTAGEQREDRLKTAMAGYIGDGALVRVSTLRKADDSEAYLMLSNFLKQLVSTMPAANQPALIGNPKA